MQETFTQNIKKSINLLITSVIRPSVIEKTIKSWNENLQENNKDYKFEVIINIDPIGESYKPQYIENIVSKYFRIKKCFTPSYPSFPLAVKKLWESTDTKYSFFLEDDMVLLKPVFMNDIIDKMEKHDINVMRLDKKGCNAEDTEIKRKSKCTYTNGVYLFNSHDYGISLNPSLFEINIIKELCCHFIDGTSPERILRSKKTKEIDDIMKKYRYGIYMEPGDSPYVQDIGTKWKKSQNFKKPGGGVTSTWVKRK